MLSLFKRKPRPLRRASVAANPLFQLQPLEPRLLLSADPLTGVFDDTLNAEISAVDDNAEALGELVQALDKLATIEDTVGEKSADDKQSFAKPVAVSQGLFISTADDISSSPGEAGGDSSWGHNDVVSATNVTFEPTGSQSALFEQAFSLDAFADGTVEINGLHYVATDVIVGDGGNESAYYNFFYSGYDYGHVDLQQGDVLFSTANTVEFTGSDGKSVTISAGDIGVFRPDTVGNYSSGSFIWLINNVVDTQEGHNLSAFTLIEQDTSIAGHNLSAGDFLVTIDQADHDDFIYHISPEEAGATSEEVLIELISENGVDFDAKDIQGLEILETAQTVGGVSFSAGTLLVANDKNNKEEIRAYEFSGSSTDIRLGDATETVLWEMSDILNDDTTIDALAIANIVENINVDPTGGVTIDGTATEDQTLTANTSTLADEDGLGVFSYQWLREGSVITGATSDNYTLGDADVGRQIAVQVSYTDGYNTDELVTSSATSAVTNINDAPTGDVNITGTAQEDETLTADVSGIADGDGLGSFSYQWLRDGTNIGSASSQNYTLTDSDVGSEITVTVSYTDAFGTNESLTSAASATVTNINDAPVGLPVINGTEQEDQTLSVATASISDADGLGSFSYQWLRDGDEISGATSNVYTLVDDDVDNHISVRVSYTDGHGASEEVTSLATGSIVNINDPLTGVVVILGNTVEGQSLTPDLSALVDNDGLGVFSYQWQRDSIAIPGATASSYELTAADVNGHMSVVISYTDGHGTNEQIISQNSTMVTASVTTDVASASISGTYEEYQTLTAIAELETAGGTPIYSFTNVQYQWFRGDVAISGAVSDSYTLTVDDVGEEINVSIELENIDGYILSASSSNTDLTANVSDTPTGAVTITGTVTEDQRLSAVTSALADNDGLGSFNYQWLRDGSVIGGATAHRYWLTDDDVGAVMSVQVSYTDGFGDSEIVTSADTVAVANVNDALTGSVVISGGAVDGQTLVADASSLADDDGLGALSYQWLRDSTPVGANTDSYVLSNADVGAVMSVQVSYTDANGTLEQIASATTAVVINTNDPVSGAVVINGIAKEDETLSADTSSLVDDDGLGALNYQWLRNGVAISGATASSYTLDDADVSELISVQVNYTDGQGTDEQVTSAQTIAVENINDLPSGVFNIAGTAIEDQSLVVNVSSLTDDDGVGEVGVQWLRDGIAITDADDISYLLEDADVGTQISVQLNYTDGNGTYEQLTSAATAQVLGVNDAPAGGVLISGVAEENQTLTADTSALSDDDGLGSFSYQWQRNGIAIVGATADSHTLSDADVGALISVLVSYTDGQGSDEQVVSTSTAVVAGINDSPVGDVLVSGTAEENQILSADTSAVADDDGLGAFDYQWLRDGVEVVGADSDTYLLDDADVGTTLAVQISYLDGQGTGERLTSVVTAVVTNINDAPTGSVQISGTLEEDQTISADTSAIADDDGLGSYRYQWLADGEEIAGATGASYTLGDADVGVVMSVQVSYTDGFGTFEQLSSAASIAVLNVNDLPTDNLLLVGENVVGEALSVDATKLIDADGVGDITYQWLRDGEVIVGATEATYELVQDDLDAEVSVAVSYVDSHGQTEIITSKVVTVIEKQVYELAVVDTAIDEDIESALHSESDTSEASDEDSSDSTTVEGDEVVDAVDADETTGSIGDTSTLQVFAIGALEAEEDFTQQQQTSFSSDFGDASSQQFGVSSVSVSAFENDSLGNAYTDDWFQSDSFASLENFLDPLVLVKNAAFNSSFDQLRQQYLELSEEEQVLWTSTTTLSASFTVGYAVWMLRSGVLLSTALSALPAWRFIDPLPVLMSSGAVADSDGESLQSMVSESSNESSSDAKETC